MGTRGFVGFVSDEKETITYNHWDSYPDGLGLTVLRFARKLAADGETLEKYRVLARDVKQVSDDVKPTRDEIVELIKYSNLSVSERDAEDWYCLLRETHGNPEAILSCGYADHAPDWPKDSLMCEWGYLINFDTLKLEAYEGFQQAPPRHGRWAGQRLPLSSEPFNSNSYHAVELKATYSIYDLPTDEEFVGKLDPNEEN